MRCPNCEAVNRDSAKFCDECGFPLTGALAERARAVSLSGEVAIVEDFPVEETVESAPQTEEAPVSDEAAQVAEEQEEAEEAQETEESLKSEEPEEPEGLETPEESEKPEEHEEHEEAVAGEPEKEKGFDADREFYDLDKTLELPLPLGSADREKAPAPPVVPVIDLSDDKPDPNGTVLLKATRSPEPQEPKVDVTIETETGAVAHFAPIVKDVPEDMWSADITMSMPRVEQDEPVVNRDYLASATKSKKKRNGGKIALTILLVAVVIAGVVFATYQAGIWGGKVVPSVIGMTESDAKSVLVEQGFQVKTFQVKSDDTEGLVLLMDPNENSRAAEGSEIVIHVATARLIPDIAGRPLEEAQAALAEAGYSNVRIEMQRSDDEPNTVIGVAPEPGSRALSSSEVVLTVTEPFRVPDISGMSLDEARQAITDAGLTSQAVYVDTKQYEEGTLTGTEPQAGTVVHEGDLVTIGIARSRGSELEELTQSLLAPGNEVSIGGVDYDIVSLKSVYYEGDNTVAFSATARPKISFFGETLYTSGTQSIQGEVVWSEGNKVIGIYA